MQNSSAAQVCAPGDKYHAKPLPDDFTLYKKSLKTTSIGSLPSFILHLQRACLPLHTWGFCYSPGSSFQESLITSFSHCCWQFSTSVLWKPPLPGIVFFLSVIFPPSWSEAKSHLQAPKQSLNDFFRSQQEAVQTSRNFKTSSSKVRLRVKSKLSVWLPGFCNTHLAVLKKKKPILILGQIKAFKWRQIKCR